MYILYSISLTESVVRMLRAYISNNVTYQRFTQHLALVYESDI